MKGDLSGRKIFIVALLAFLFTLSISSTNLQGSLDLEERVVEYVLPNGLTFLLLERRYPPVFSTNITYKVGSVEEVSGITGIAHLLEHMAFKGTKTIGTTNYRREKKILERIDRLAREIDRLKNSSSATDSLILAQLEEKLQKARDELGNYVVKDEIGVIYGENGAVGLNASTSEDLTRYYVSLPSNRLELWMFIESERMKGPVFREFYTERDVVMEERRMRTLTNPFGKLYEVFLATAFLAHPYGHPTVGWMSDLERLTVDDARRFFEKYYTPSNCVVAIVGDIDIEKTKRLIDRYFGPVKARGRPPRVMTVEPLQDGERRADVVFDSEPMLLVGYHKPALPQFDDYVFDMISIILTSGRTSRFYHRLIESGMAVNVTSSTYPGDRFPNLFTIYATPRSPYTTSEIEDVIYEELEKLGTVPVDDVELKRAVKKIETSFIRSLASNSGLANRLTYFQSIAGDYRYITGYVDVVKGITKSDIMDVASRYFTKNNRTVASIVKEATE
ncbi:MAG: M16 family metallopeptidase [Candidatus Glassbacteria bacterium]